jgi:hypothetical protein
MTEHSHAAVDYESLPERSLMGSEDEPTVKAIERAVVGGTLS